MKLDKKKQKQKPEDCPTELSRIVEALNKLVFIAEFQLKSAGVKNIQYPKKEESK